VPGRPYAARPIKSVKSPRATKRGSIALAQAPGYGLRASSLRAMSLLILVHHGDAVGPDVDPMRPLSSVGRAATERLAAPRPTAASSRCDLAQRKASCAPDGGAVLEGVQPVAPMTAERGCCRRSATVDARSPRRRGAHILIASHMPYCRGCSRCLRRARRCTRASSAARMRGARSDGRAGRRCGGSRCSRSDRWGDPNDQAKTTSGT
jgi:hypothetical protein